MAGGRSHDCRGLPCSLEAVSRAGVIRRQRIRQNWGRWAGSLLSGVTLILGTLRKPAQQPMRAPPGKSRRGMDCRPPSFRDLQRVVSVEQAAPCPSNSQPHGDLRWTSPAHVLDTHALILSSVWSRVMQSHTLAHRFLPVVLSVSVPCAALDRQCAATVWPVKAGSQTANPLPEAAHEGQVASACFVILCPKHKRLG